MNADSKPIAADGTYDAFAVFDSVPAIVRTLDKSESRYLSLLLAFIGVGSAFIGAPKDFHLP
jgi:hypothetical protein